MIRLILVVLILLLYLILGIPVLLIEWLIGRWNPYLRDISCLRMVQAAFKLILWVSGPISLISAGKMSQRTRQFSISATTTVILTF